MNKNFMRDFAMRDKYALIDSVSPYYKHSNERLRHFWMYAMALLTGNQRLALA